jgi:hypothetical protein
MQVQMVINGEDPIGWQELGMQDVIRDGQPHTYTWVIPDALTSAMAGVDDTIGWFELMLVTNLDGASVTKLYIDNIQIYYEAPPSGAPTPTVFDFETGAQGWGDLKDGTAVTVSAETHSGGGSQSLSATIDEAAHGQQEAGWASPRDFTVDQAEFAAGGYSTLSFWYRVDDPDLNGGNFVFHWISSTESWSGGGWYGNGLWGVLIADSQWHQQTADLSILGEAAGGWQGTWGDLGAWEFRGDLLYSFEIVVSPTDNTTGSNIYIDDVVLE